MAKYEKEYTKPFYSLASVSNFYKMSIWVICAFHNIIVYCPQNKFSFNFDPTIDASGVFLDISKAFGKVWHKGILFRLTTYGVNGKMLALPTNYFDEHIRE